MTHYPSAASGAVWLETGEALNYIRTEERTGIPTGQPAWGGGCDRVTDAIGLNYFAAASLALYASLLSPVASGATESPGLAY